MASASTIAEQLAASIRSGEGTDLLRRTIEAATLEELVGIRESLEDRRELWDTLPALVEAVGERARNARTRRAEFELEELRWIELHSFTLRRLGLHKQAAERAYVVDRCEKLPCALPRNGIDPRCRARITIGTYQALIENHAGVVRAFNGAARTARSKDYARVLMAALPALLRARDFQRLAEWVSRAERSLRKSSDPHRAVLATELKSYKGALASVVSGPAAGVEFHRQAYELALTGAPHLVDVMRARLALSLASINLREAQMVLTETVATQTSCTDETGIRIARARVHLTVGALEEAHVECERLLALFPTSLPGWPAPLEETERGLAVTEELLSRLANRAVVEVCTETRAQVRNARALAREERRPLSPSEHRSVIDGLEQLRARVADHSSGRTVTREFVLYSDGRLVRRVGDSTEGSVHPVLASKWFVDVVRRLAAEPLDPDAQHRKVVTVAQVMDCMRKSGKSVQSVQAIRRAIFDEKQRLGLGAEELVLGVRHTPGGYYLDD